MDSGDELADICFTDSVQSPKQVKRTVAKSVTKNSETVKRKIKGVVKEIKKTERASPAKPKKRKTKKLIDFTSLNIDTPGHLIVNEQYIVYSPRGADAKADVIGIDIGEIHIGIAGLRIIDRDSRPRVAWFGILSLPSKAAHFVCDKLNEILVRNSDFAWVRSAKYHRYLVVTVIADTIRIELQVRNNVKAQVIAEGVRSCLRTYLITQDRDPDVEYVHGDKKYAYAPKYSTACANDPLREEILSGRTNKSKRKQLGENDVLHLLSESKEQSARLFLEELQEHADQLHDITDAYLIGAIGYDDIVAAEEKMERKKKRCKSNPVKKRKLDE